MFADVRIATCHVHAEDAEVHLLQARQAAGADGNEVAPPERPACRQTRSDDCY